MTSKNFKQYGKEVIKIELQTIEAVLETINGDFSKACEILLKCKGRVIVMGMGKSGRIGSKIAATLASTGTPSFFVHPAEASHGDLGMITKGDVVLALSNSGSTEELLTLLPLIKRLGAPLIAMTSGKHSPLAKNADVFLHLPIEKEACPFNLAPTASTTAMLVLGDALAIALLKARNFTKEDFALSHPGGKLGKQLLLRVQDLMKKGNDVPIVSSGTKLSAALIEMSQKRLGMTAITNKQGKAVGIFTDGDLRRTLDKGFDVHQTLIDHVMTTHFTSIGENALAAEALKLMEEKRINSFLVLDESKRPIGAFNLHDLLQAGVV